MTSGIPLSGKRATKCTAKIIAHNGKSQTVKEWADEIGLSISCIDARLRKGLSVELALMKEVMQKPDSQMKTGYRQAYQQGEAHRVIAKKALGHALPPNAEVHHVDGNGLNNTNGNLVICPDKAYHRLLHVRQNAMDRCGNPNMRRCYICGQWDSPANMYINRSARHRACHTQNEINRRSAA